MRPGTLVCSAMPFGYGPAAKLLTLAAALRRDWRLVFVGRGSALELIRREPHLFEEIVPMEAGGAAVESRIANAWGALSVMDREAGAAAQRLGKPLFVVDSLLWMRRQVPEAFRSARHYFAQRFPGLDPAHHEPRPTLVGPIVARSSEPSSRPREGLVVHLGGSAAPDERREVYRSYARFVARAIRDANLLERFGRITVLAGAAAVEALGGDSGRSDLPLVSASHPEARERMASAAAVVSAPGLTTALECFQDGTPVWFLPPQNYSQWCILRHLRARGAAGDALHWEDLSGEPRLADRLPTEERDPFVVAEISRLTRDRFATNALRERLARVGVAPEHQASRQRSFYESLGPPGTESIVATLRHDRDAVAPTRGAQSGATA